MVRRCKLFLLFYLLLSMLLLSPAFSANSAAAEAGQPALALSAETETARRGKKLRFTARWQTGGDLRQLAAFRLHLQYDEAYLTLTGVTPADGMDSSSLYAHMTADGAVVVYASNRRTVPLADGLCCTFVFDVGEDAPAGSTAVTVSADQLVTGDLEKLAELPAATCSVQMERLLSHDALLESLVPSAGELTPRFSPEITEYTLAVPYDVTQLTFDAKPKDNAAVRVNRKNLGKAGSATTFVLTVTAEDGEAKTEYVITATRGEKPADESDAASKKAAVSSKKTSSKETTSSGSSKKATAAGTAGENTGGTTQYGDKVIYYNENLYSVFVIGALCAAVCLLAVALVLLARRREPAAKNKKEPPDEKKK